MGWPGHLVRSVGYPTTGLLPFGEEGNRADTDSALLHAIAASLERGLYVCGILEPRRKHAPWNSKDESLRPLLSGALAAMAVSAVEFYESIGNHDATREVIRRVKEAMVVRNAQDDRLSGCAELFSIVQARRRPPIDFDNSHIEAIAGGIRSNPIQLCQTMAAGRLSGDGAVRALADVFGVDRETSQNGSEAAAAAASGGLGLAVRLAADEALRNWPNALHGSGEGRRGGGGGGGGGAFTAVAKSVSVVSAAARVECAVLAEGSGPLTVPRPETWPVPSEPLPARLSSQVLLLAEVEGAAGPGWCGCD